MSPATVWLRRQVRLPTGDWNRAVLRLKGARFAPEVWVNGERVSGAAGGMAPTEHELPASQLAPGGAVKLEVALRSLRDLDPADASAVPVADRWRSNISSGLWDSVELHLYRDARLVRLLPSYEPEHGQLALQWQASAPARAGAARRVRLELMRDADGTVLATVDAPAPAMQGRVALALPEGCALWSPEHPALHRLRVTLLDGDSLLDWSEFTWGRRDFRVEGKQLRLNDEPVRLRGVSVVWHRWLRDPEAAALAWDVDWFDRQIVSRLRTLGGNYLRFHLGLPPERLLDLCDRRGLLVQIEWPFFHGIPASRRSMEEQWRAWLDVAARHPSVVLVQPWNETEPDALRDAPAALAAIQADYPRLVIAHRDMMPVHKYWWSLFENLGLYYDSAEQFPQAVVVDEFGGNYLDGQGEPGAYPTVKESQRRFLGARPTREQRLQLQADSCGRVAEYWRRLGVAGFAPFCALSSPADGNHWFLGPLSEGRPKPVWAALSAAFAPVSASIDMWDRNFSCGDRVPVPVQIFNDTSSELCVPVRVCVVAVGEVIREEAKLVQTVPAHGTVRTSVSVQLPTTPGEWRLEATVVSAANPTLQPSVSTWRARTMDVVVPPALAGTKIALPENETELRAFLTQNGLACVGLGDPTARLVVTSAASWSTLASSSPLRAALDSAIRAGQSVVMLDVGPKLLGPGYPDRGEVPLEKLRTVVAPRHERRALVGGVIVDFHEVTEPESHLHPAENDASLWWHLPQEATWLWNGLRGGLIAPAAEMEISGLGATGSAMLWTQRGADSEALRAGRPIYAYEMAGYYEFSASPDDKAAVERLNQRVRFLIEDAPSLSARIEQSGGLRVVDLRATLNQISVSARATRVVPLAHCGNNLARTPVVGVEFGVGEGTLIVSQVLTADRLSRRRAPAPDWRVKHHDPAAEQFVLNLLARALPKNDRR
ncbi:MAG: hypothetical protein KF715_02645 [Candidatus Didemnitutus sp.]|nr:hypothetical protein [Candidatus Didemnitutus sp.]